MLAVLLGLTLLVLPRGFARARYVAGCVTLALMLLAPTFTIWQLADPARSGLAVLRGRAGIRTRGRSASGSELLGDSTTPLRTTSPSRDTRLVVDPNHVLPWVVMAWAIGVLVCSMRLAGGWWQARRLVRLGTRPIATHWDQVKDTLAARLGLSRTVRLLESTRLHVPVVVGWLRPVLLVPTAVLGGLSPAAARGGHRARVGPHPATRLHRQPASVCRRDVVVLPPRRLVGLERRPHRARALLRRPGGGRMRRRRPLRPCPDGHRDIATRRDGSCHGRHRIAPAGARAPFAWRQATRHRRLVGLDRRVAHRRDGVGCWRHQLDTRRARRVHRRARTGAQGSRGARCPDHGREPGQPHA